MTPRSKLNLYLWLAGSAGVVSTLLIDLSALVKLLPLPPGQEPLEITWLIKLASLIQPAVIVTVAVLVGAGLSGKVGLDAPAARAAAAGDGFFRALTPQIMPGLLGGMLGGMLIVVIAQAALPYLPDGAFTVISQFAAQMPIATRILYGGITEEILLRWGFMSLVVFAVWQGLAHGSGAPPGWAYVLAILVSSLLFGIGHLPIAFFLFQQPTAPLIVFVVAANSVFGIIAGYLFWKRGLESAIIAHMTAHLVMYGASWLGAYF